MLDPEKEGERAEDLWFDLSDEERCNWMMFVRPAQNHLEQNLVAYQYGSDIFYTTIKNIQPKQELKVSIYCKLKDKNDIFIDILFCINYNYYIFILLFLQHFKQYSIWLWINYFFFSSFWGGGWILKHKKSQKILGHIMAKWKQF